MVKVVMEALLHPPVFHFSQRFTTVVPESCMLILLGLVLGGVVLIASKKQLYQLDPALFFLFLLPTIVGDAGYFMPARLFFDNLGAILMYAVVGTLWNAFCTGFCLYAAKLLGVIGQLNVRALPVRARLEVRPPVSLFVRRRARPGGPDGLPVVRRLDLSRGPGGGSGRV